MLSFSEITAAVRSTLERNSPRYLSIEEVLELLPIRDQLITQLARNTDRVGARWAAMSMVRDALATLGAEMQFAFDGVPPANDDREKQPTPEGVHVVYRLIGGAR
jgi:hypothetical protein